MADSKESNREKPQPTDEETLRLTGGVRETPSSAVPAPLVREPLTPQPRIGLLAMQGKFVPVTNVTVWPHVNWPKNGGVGPVIPPVICDASGQYAVGTLFTNIFYNLNLDDVTPKYPLRAGALYSATLTTASGATINTPAMICTNDGEDPKFGMTVHGLSETGVGGHGAAAMEAAVVESPGDLIDLASLTDVTVTQTLAPPAIGTITRASGCKGELVATRTGTPHLTGFTVDLGKSGTRFEVGSTGYSVSGKRADTGDHVSLGRLTCRAGGANPLFLQSFPA